MINDTQPALTAVELLRILIDEEMLVWDEAWRIVFDTFTFTNHSLRAKAAESWPIEMLEKILPRHLTLIYDINFYFLEHLRELKVDEHKIAALSLIDETAPRSVRFAHLCFICSHRSFGVSSLHVENLKRGLLSEVNEVYPGRLSCANPIVSPLRWIHCANPELSALLTECLGGDDSWLKDLSLLKSILA